MGTQISLKTYMLDLTFKYATVNYDRIKGSNKHLFSWESIIKQLCQYLQVAKHRNRMNI